MPRPDIMRPIKPAEEIKNGSITVATSEASFQNVDPDINQYVASGDIVSGNTDRFDNINYYAQDGKLIPIVGQTPAAAYSLRALSGKTNASVVRLRRLSGSAEKDFAANELIGSSEGAEVVTNGGFDTDSDWTKGGGWSITGGQAVYDGSYPGYSWLAQDGIISTEAGRYYKITFTVVAGSGPPLGGGLLLDGKLRSFQSMGIYYPGRTYSLVFRTNGPTPTSPSKGWFRFAAYRSNTITVDNVSCVEYTPTIAEIWSLNAIEQNGAVSLEDEKAFITTWYDQSGNGNHATQATAARQPLLILGGVTQLENGKPALSFDGVDDDMAAGTGWFPTAGDYLAFSVFSYSGSAGDDSCLFGTGGAANGFWYVNTDFGTATDQVRVYNDKEVFVGSSLLGAGQVLYSFDKVGDNEGGTYNGVADGTGTRTTTNDDNAFTIASHPTSARLFTGNIQELVVYDSDQSANRTKIEKSINDYYNIYAYPDKPLISDTNPEAAAAYSLRYLSDYPTVTPVVRLARRRDFAERDFKAAEIAPGTAGSELLTNGGFDTDSDWTKDTGWSITGGQAVFSGTGGCPALLSQAVEDPEADFYLVSFDLVSVNDTLVCALYIGSNNLNLFLDLEIQTPGSYSFIYKGPVDTFSFGTCDIFGPVTATIDNLSLKPYTPSAAELWVIEASPIFVSYGGQRTACAHLNDIAQVTTWYDQSGNGNHATQATQGEQPNLIIAGVMEMENGKPAMVFDGFDWLDLNDVELTATLDNFSAFVVVQTDEPTDTQIALSLSTTNRLYIPYLTGGNTTVSYQANSSMSDGGSADTSQTMVSLVVDKTNSLARSFKDGAAFSVDATEAISTNATVNTNNGIGALGTPSTYWNGRIQEIIVYDSDQSTKRISIENQINSYYGIY